MVKCLSELRWALRKSVRPRFELRVNSQYKVSGYIDVSYSDPGTQRIISNVRSQTRGDFDCKDRHETRICRVSQPDTGHQMLDQEG